MITVFTSQAHENTRNTKNQKSEMKSNVLFTDIHLDEGLLFEP